MFTIGADPEFFIQKYDGTMQPIVGLLGGTKDKPIAVQGARKGFAVQEDNVMAEYNIPPTAHADQFADSARHPAGSDVRMQPGLRRLRTGRAASAYQSGGPDHPGGRGVALRRGAHSSGLS